MSHNGASFESSAQSLEPPVLNGSSDAVVETLLPVLRETFGVSDVVLENIHRSTGGFSRENWTFDARLRTEGNTRRVPLIMRRDPKGTLLESDREHEISVLRALESTPIPGPRIVYADPTGRIFERPTIVMKREEGECDWWVLNGALPLVDRLNLADDFIALLASVQRVSLTDLAASSLVDPGPEAPRYELERWREVLDRNALEPHPELAIAYSWLRARLFETSQRVLVHGDFKPGNILLHDTRPPVLLDWETAHIGDPLEDLGGITNPVRAKEQMIRSSWERAEIIESYERHTGRVVNPAQLLWWNVLANYKLATIVLTGVRAWVAGRFDRIMQPPTALYRKMFELMNSEPTAL